MRGVGWRRIGHVLVVHDAGHVFREEVAGVVFVIDGDLGDAFSVVERGWNECHEFFLVFCHFVIAQVGGKIVRVWWCALAEMQSMMDG